MESFYLIIVVVLFVLAISDLIVGVSNDAVNFLNSAIGSKAAPRWIIMLIASFGILLGATFSSGMMEVARKGIFHPDHFYFAEIMIIFVAVMLTDILLLDFYNSVGLPTSTTVSIVFELLGAAVAVALVKISYSDETFFDLGKYINSDKALAIIGGILLSVIIAFLFGALVQYITRFIFTYKIDKTFKYFGTTFGGFAITAITYFILIKGAKGSSFITEQTLNWIKENTVIILLICFVGWTIILQLLIWITRLNILKIIVLVGTFALAMAFAGNDLVNFIGVPLAGFKSFQHFLNIPNADPNSLTMGILSQKVHTETYLLVIAGLVMTITLWLSKKARTVTETEIGLSTQSEGDEKFESSYFARLIVRSSLTLNSKIRHLLPESIRNIITKRFDKSDSNHKLNKKDIPAFDMIRASVNLTVASILIAIGTSLKLPLSTTYVTFMVAMGTSLSDRAWGRDTAVYRITGVLTVIGGWFFTAFIAFTAAFIFTNLIKWLGGVAILGLLIIAITLITRSYVLYRRKSREKVKKEEKFSLDKRGTVEQCTNLVSDILKHVPEIYNNVVKGIVDEDRNILKDTLKTVHEINAEAKTIKNNVPNVVKELRKDSIKTGPYYVQLIDYLREIAHALNFISEPVFEHVDNNHKGLIQEQRTELFEIQKAIDAFYKNLNQIIINQDFVIGKIAAALKEEQMLIKLLGKFRKEQIRRIKDAKVGTRNSVLYLGILNETKNLLLYTGNLLKASRDFVTLNNES